MTLMLVRMKNGPKKLGVDGVAATISGICGALVAYARYTLQVAVKMASGVLAAGMASVYLFVALQITV